ncbi:hypothetical protein AWM70_13010 [Paenibacillus yonginensis]|uniref:Uncharacterized protein n=1 Tax=Paenibacillus yonginensis TaxID=1462996 RepID=A0A1B1N1W0_9BACL|nr:hypothetical protein AWM70_13010 [Paenibacillus yonginensis]
MLLILPFACAELVMNPAFIILLKFAGNKSDSNQMFLTSLLYNKKQALRSRARLGRSFGFIPV